jgi:hypothetical protein
VVCLMRAIASKGVQATSAQMNARAEGRKSATRRWLNLVESVKIDRPLGPFYRHNKSNLVWQSNDPMHIKLMSYQPEAKR